MSTYVIEPNERVKYFSCPHCGEKSVTVMGIHSDGFQSSRDLLREPDDRCKETDASVRLTISFGGWGQDDSKSRWWIFIEATPTVDSYEIMVREPEESVYFGEKLLGSGVSCTEALASPHRDNFFAVADCIAFNDPAMKSYLSGRVINLDGRHAKV